MKVLNSTHLSPFGGLNFVHEELDRLKIGEVLGNELPLLPKQSKYDWRDLLYSFWSVYFCGGDCMEDLSVNLRRSFENSPMVKTPSPDSVLKRIKELAVPCLHFDTPRGKRSHKFSINHRLNALNLKIVRDRIKDARSTVVLDYDNTLIFSQKADAAMTYQKQCGYAPGVGIINDQVVYIENRNGNSGAQILQQDTLLRMFTLLEKEGVRPTVFRADGASYKLSTLATIDKHAKGSM